VEILTRCCEGDSSQNPILLPKLCLRLPFWREHCC
jgi:hypothetical protein